MPDVLVNVYGPGRVMHMKMFLKYAELLTPFCTRRTPTHPKNSKLFHDLLKEEFVTTIRKTEGNSKIPDTLISKHKSSRYKALLFLECTRNLYV